MQTTTTATGIWTKRSHSTRDEVKGKTHKNRHHNSANMLHYRIMHWARLMIFPFSKWAARTQLHTPHFICPFFSCVIICKCMETLCQCDRFFIFQLNQIHLRRCFCQACACVLYIVFFLPVVYTFIFDLIIFNLRNGRCVEKRADKYEIV